MKLGQLVMRTEDLSLSLPYFGLYFASAVVFLWLIWQSQTSCAIQPNWAGYEISPHSLLAPTADAQLANKKYVVNWAKAFFYLVPQIPNHPSRDDIIKIMKNDEPRMIENFRLMKKFKTEVTK